MHTSILKTGYLHFGFLHLQANHVAILRELENQVKVLNYQTQSTDINDSNERPKFKYMNKIAINFKYSFDVLLTVHLSIFILVINQLDAPNFHFTISLFHASTCFEHNVLIIRRSKFYYTASGIITPIGGRPVHRLREDSLNLCTGRPHIGVMIREAV